MELELELELERERVAIDEIVDGYLGTVVHGHQGCDAIPPALRKVGSFSVAPR